MSSDNISFISFAILLYLWNEIVIRIVYLLNLNRAGMLLISLQCKPKQNLCVWKLFKINTPTTKFIK